MTNWNLVRDMMKAAIDACERMEAVGLKESDRDAAISVGGQDVTVQDFLTSAWIYPENIRYAIIRGRHALGDDLAYVPEAARILVAMAQAAAETGSDQHRTAVVDDIREMIAWYEVHAVPGIEQAITDRRG